MLFLSLKKQFELLNVYTCLQLCCGKYHVSFCLHICHTYMILLHILLQQVDKISCLLISAFIQLISRRVVCWKLKSKACGTSSSGAWKKSMLMLESSTKKLTLNILNPRTSHEIRSMKNISYCISCELEKQCTHFVLQTMMWRPLKGSQWLIERVKWNVSCYIVAICIDVSLMNAA